MSVLEPKWYYFPKEIICTRVLHCIVCNEVWGVTKDYTHPSVCPCCLDDNFLYLMEVI